MQPLFEAPGVFDRKDWFLLSLLTTAAVLLSFLCLGSLRTPSRFWRPGRAGDVVIADLGGTVSIDRITAYAGLGTGSCIIEASPDGETWEHPLRVRQEQWDAVEWRAASLKGYIARYIKVTVEAPGLALGEVAVFSQGKTVSPVSVVELSGSGDAVTAAPAAAANAASGVHPLFDEPSTAAFTPSKDTGMYFDEVYFARAGLAIAQGGADPETTHPPLAKLFSALGILVFGPSPFGWRFLFALAGAASVPVMFLLARGLLGSTEGAFFSGFLFLLDFMRVVQSRIATPDAFVLLFTLSALALMRSALSSPAPAGRLLMAGVFLGLGGASKWSGLFAAPVMGIFFLVLVIRRRRYAPDIALGFLSFIVVPAAVYLASYAPWLARGEPLLSVLSHQGAMFNYHAGALQSHAYSSPWWQWPLVIRPVWIYAGAADLPAGMVRSVASFGDPLVWWPAAVAVAAAAAAAVRRRDLAAAFIVISFLSLYLPWVVSPRKLTFLYHYLPCVPFLILALGGVLRRFTEAAPRAGKLAGRLYLGLAAALFAAFAPVLYGILVPQGWVRLLTWLPTWTFRI